MTLTYYQRSTALASGVHAVNQELAFDPATAAAVALTIQTLVAGQSASLYMFTTASGAPGQAAWGSGTYRAQLNCTTAGANVTYGLRTVGTAAGHFARVASGLTSPDTETIAQAEAAFTGTGLKLATASWSPAAGSTGDRFEILVAANNAGTMSQSFGLTANTTDSYADGPFDGGGAVDPFPAGQVAATARPIIRRAA